MSAVHYRHLCSLWIALIFFPAATVGARQATSPKPVTPAYAITELQTLGTTGLQMRDTSSLKTLDPTSEANAINNRGQIVGWTQNVLNHHRAVLWENGVAIATLGTLGGASSEALALNDNGQVVGRAATADGKSVAFVWQDYVMRRLALPDSGDSAATGTNARGQIVGYRSVRRVEKAGKPPRTLPFPRAFLWQQGRMTDLYEVGTGGYSSAAGINAAGEVVGVSAPGNLNSGVFVWTQPGKWYFSDYAIVGGHRGAGGSAINDAGDVVGSGMVGNDRQDRIRFHAFLQPRGGAIDLGGFGEGSSRALALNNKGQVVGTAFVMQGNTEQGHRAFLWQKGILTDLNDAVKAHSGWTLKEARGINDRGQIVGVGAHGHCRRAFLLTPVPAANSTPAQAGTSTPLPAAKTPNERLYEGASGDNIGLMQSALRDGANINAQFGIKREFALMITARGNMVVNMEAFAFVLRQHPDVNLRDEAGRTALSGLIEDAANSYFEAHNDNENEFQPEYIRFPDERVIRLLINNGANVNIPDIKGKTALQWARILVAESKSDWNHEQAEHFARLLQNAGAKRRPTLAKSDNRTWN